MPSEAPSAAAPRARPAGYSGTPLAAKLGIRPGCALCVSGAPPDYDDLVAPLPPGVRRTSRLAESNDIVHLFVEQAAVLEAQLRSHRPRLKPDGVIWVSWPKKASKRPTDITEDTIRAIALPLGFVDVKVCAVDATWSGLKLVIRRALRDTAKA